jgi:catechol 2,3-dioxygenase-like lactoylglutathione lyase family enzyme
MKPRITVITLSVDQLERSLAFYRDGLGLSTMGIVGEEVENGAVIFIHMNDELILALYPRKSMAKDAKVPLRPPSPSDFSLGHYVRSKEEVDAVLRQAERAGACITDPAHDRSWGVYSGYFQDPDGHLWEIACDPDLEIQE